MDSGGAPNLPPGIIRPGMAAMPSQVGPTAGKPRIKQTRTPVRAAGSTSHVYIGSAPALALTAEAVAEYMHCPLHSITSGDLGSAPGEVERNLSQITALVARWNAVLLIDECDVFLEARTSHDLERNQMVSIFLRTLEYYEGVMFMTTNRGDNIDSAFQSRIHVSIEYPELVADSRRQIWTALLKSSSVAHELSDGDLDSLARLPLNGRQIKNILRSCQLLALRRKTPFSEALVKTVYNIEKRRSGLQH